MAESRQAASGGIGLGGAVFLVFLVLKLTGHIDWSWWWVTAPLWGIFAVALALMVLGALFMALGALAEHFGRARSER